jgi:hypothetical protein
MISTSYTELEKMIIDFENKFGSGMGLMGDSIKDNLIKNLQEALGLMQAVGYNGGGNLDQLINSETESLDNYVNLLLYQQALDYNRAKQNNDSTGMANAHKKAEDIRKLYGRPLSSDGSADTIYQDWLKANGLSLTATSLQAVSVNSIVRTDISKTLSKAAIPSIDRSKIVNSTTSNAGSLSIDNLVRIDGNITSENMGNIKEFANLVLAQVWENLKQKGVT